MLFIDHTHVMVVLDHPLCQC